VFLANLPPVPGRGRSLVLTGYHLFQPITRCALTTGVEFPHERECTPDNKEGTCGSTAKRRRLPARPAPPSRVKYVGRRRKHVAGFLPDRAKP
jgi:hypothetical protein